MNKRVSAQAAARQAVRDEKAAQKEIAQPVAGTMTKDSFVNFAQKMGIGADNPMSSAGYGFNPITRVRTLLEWIYRGTFIGGVAVDLVAEDMTRAGVEIESELPPDEINQIHAAISGLGIWNAITETIKWARLYGGALAVMLVDGQDPKTPLRLETISKGQFKGLCVLDRWMVQPSLNDLVTDYGPSLGLPKYYSVVADAPALPRMTIHYSRCLRLEGVSLPYYQRVMENLWGISVYERLYDRMTGFDAATTGASQLVYKSFMRTYKVQGLREIVSAGGPALQGFMKYVEMIRRFQGIEGMSVIDGNDDMATMQHTAFSGLSDVLLQLGQQLSGALQIPLVRLFGQSPTGLNSSGESELRMYYDGILQQQETKLRIPLTRIYRAAGNSLGITIPPGFNLVFKSLWQLTDEQKGSVAQSIANAIVAAEEAGLISQKIAMQELRQSSHTTGVFSNITDDDIANAEEELPPPGEEARGGQVNPEAAEETTGKEPEGTEPERAGAPKPEKSSEAKEGESEKEKAE